jgi:indolepyruvate ferredoxin oxidoreductase
VGAALAPDHQIAARRGKRLALTTLEDRFERYETSVHITGIQAIVRVVVEQQRSDRARGLDTAGFVSGYPGSPLGGVDRELARRADLLRAHGVRHIPGVNEELAITAIMGSQLAPALPGATVAGVNGLWYGKAPGLDRAGDALKHGNFTGSHPLGGVVVVVGDDPAAKSSTIPNASEVALSDALIPVLFPGNVQQLFDYGLHAYEMSRVTGLWAGLKVVTSLADSSGTAVFAAPAGQPVALERRAPVPHGRLLPPFSLVTEQEIWEQRLPAAREYARLAGIDVISGGPAPLGVVAAGRVYEDLRQALEEAGLDPGDPQAAGLRLLRLAMTWPLEPEVVRRFASGVREILVIEEKRSFIETGIKEVLYGTAGAPRVVGKADEQGGRLVPAHGILDANSIARLLARRMAATGIPVPGGLDRMNAGSERRRASLPLIQIAEPRTPFYCSGCPHSRSTRAPASALVGAGTGCMAMILYMDPAQVGDVVSSTQMGGEGAQFVGIAPFAPGQPLVQNMGEGTFHHSGQLAVRQAVASGTTMTFKILYNRSIAMTGGQQPPNVLQPATIASQLLAEGVRRVVITTDEPAGYRGTRLPAGCAVRHRDDLDAVQRELLATPGVTVLIHDQECATEKRRGRVRGRLPMPARRVMINPRVCEGCGDCVSQANCLSLQPVDTSLGPKMSVHQSSCNLDASCLLGDCPSFVSVPAKAAGRAGRGGGAATSSPTSSPPTSSPPTSAALPPPPACVAPPTFGLRIVGIGGTGVVTLSQIVATAASLDGLSVSALDQTGLAQKGGPVLSDVIFGTGRRPAGVRLSEASADLYLALDPTTAAEPKVLNVVSDATAAVTSTSLLLTETAIHGTAGPALDVGEYLSKLGQAVRPGALVAIDAVALAEERFGSHLPANMILLGAAVQAGYLPVGLSSLETAIRLNGGDAEANIEALNCGRRTAADSQGSNAKPARAAGPPADPAPWLLGETRLPAGLRDVVAWRAADIAGYQDKRASRGYVARVAAVAVAEQRVRPGRDELAAAAASGLHKLMTYKDEYEVARLHLLPESIDQLGGPASAYRSRFHLHPPVLRSLGMHGKIAMPGWLAIPAFRVLRAGRRLRSTPLDPFGATAVRRCERQLVARYAAALDDCAASLTDGTYEQWLAAARLPEIVRGYEQLKLDSAARFTGQLAALVPPRAATVGVAPGSVRSHHDGQE